MASVAGTLPLRGVASATVPGSLSAATAPTWQADATVWHMAYSSDRVWLVGDFSTLRPPGAALGSKAAVPASNFAVLDATSGAPEPGVDVTHVFAGEPAGTSPLARGAVAVSTDGTVVYVGGDFTSVDGQERDHIAAFDAQTGSLLPWAPRVHGDVRTIAVFGDVVYLGGDFDTVNEIRAPFIVAVSATDGSVLPWGLTPPSMNNAVEAIAVSDDGTQVVAGGYFNQVDGASRSPDGATAYNSAVIIGGVGSASAGELEPMPADALVIPVATPDCASAVKDVVISAGVAYFADEGTGLNCFDGTWSVRLSDGSLQWVNRCLGATQTVAVIGNYLYKGSHIHDCRTTNANGDPDNFPEVPLNHNRHLTSESLANGFLGPWYPAMNAGPNFGPRTMVTDGTQLYVGGDFTRVDGKSQQAIARFTPAADYPTPTPDAPVVTRDAFNRLRIVAVPPVDLDDPDLTIELFRDGRHDPVAQAHVHSLFWRQPLIRWIDPTAPAHGRPTYRVRAVPGGYGLPSAFSAPSVFRLACPRPGTVAASIGKIVAKRVSPDRRTVRVTFCVERSLRATIAVERGHGVLKRRSVHYARAGRHRADLRIHNEVAAGPAQVRVTMKRNHHKKVVSGSVRLPR